VNTEHRGGATRILFAYGALLDRTLMEHRCKRPAIVGVARVEGYQFSINVHGVATLLQHRNAVVYGLLWRVSRVDEASLDRYEGVEEGFYRKRLIGVMSDKDHRRSAFVYIATEDRIGVPRPGYLEAIISAARELEFPERYIDELRAWCGDATL
jgi:gamma-glutamylcyclotransferase (GGCT)/AIG2-like uncharacterized protein YtfP